MVLWSNRPYGINNDVTAAHGEKQSINEHVTCLNAECTFIVLDKQRWTDSSILEEECMVGDVNLFLTDPSDLSLAELEIMIAGDDSVIHPG